MKAYRPGTVKELREVLHHTITSGELAVVEVPIDNSVNHELLDINDAHWKTRSRRD